MPIREFKTLSLESTDEICHIRFTRPALANRFDAAAHTDFADALQAATDDDVNRAIVLSAEGKVFSAGGDFDEIIAAGTSAQIRDRMTRDARRVFHALAGTRLPVIGAVQGAAMGLGATIVSLCDISVAWRNAKIGDPHVSVGIVAGDGGIIGWAQSIGINRAKRFLLTGDTIFASEAHAMGLITDLVDAPEEALPKALEIAQHIISLPRAGVEGTKLAFARLTQQMALTALDIGLAYEMESMTRPEIAARIAKIRK